MHSSAISFFKLWPLLLVLLAFISQVKAVTYLDSLAAKRRPSSLVQTPSNASSLPSTTTSSPSYSANIPDDFLAPHLFGRQSSNNPYASLYTCQSIAVKAPIADLSCKNETTTSTNLLTGLLTTTTNLVCVPITVTVTVIDSICVCASGGFLTTQSLVDLRTFFIDVNNNKTGSPLATLTTYRNGAVGYTVDSLLIYLAGALPSVLNDGRSTDPCQGTYPTGAVPYCSANCGFNCPMNQRVCNGACTDAATCPSGIAGRRRAINMRQVELDLRCPRGRTACFPPSFGQKRSSHLEDRMECIDTMRDIESCGGCEFPLPGRASGMDCTAIPNVGQVQCLSGVCAIQTCRQGYTLVRSECVDTRDSIQSTQAMEDRGLVWTPDLSDPASLSGSAKIDVHPMPQGAQVVGVKTGQPGAVSLPLIGGQEQGGSGIPPTGTISQPTAEERKEATKKLLARRQVNPNDLRERKVASLKESERAGEKRTRVLKGPRIFKRR